MNDVRTRRAAKLPLVFAEYVNPRPCYQRSPRRWKIIGLLHSRIAGKETALAANRHVIRGLPASVAGVNGYDFAGSKTSYLSALRLLGPGDD